MSYGSRCNILSIVALSLTLVLSACAQQASREQSKPLEADQMLTTEAIFKDYVYDPKEPGQIRWLEDHQMA